MRHQRGKPDRDRHRAAIGPTHRIARLRNQRFFSLDDALGDYLLDLRRPVPPLDPAIDFALKSVA
ncbi:hypothetical protein [Paraburkholderia sp. 35.1]|uniref:hypothetical protein n=1 Tax=unclassified Paraburkholderia TaxID=2615204 RepID=UPI003D253C45